MVLSEVTDTEMIRLSIMSTRSDTMRRRASAVSNIAHYPMSIMNMIIIHEHCKNNFKYESLFLAVYSSKV